MLEAEHDESRLIDPEDNYNIGGLYQFVPATELHGKTDWIPESQHYQYYEENSDFPITVLKEESSLNIPPHLQVYTFDRGDFSPFPHPGSGVTRVSGMNIVVEYLILYEYMTIITVVIFLKSWKFIISPTPMTTNKLA